jgi:hypothetical protein
MNRVNLVNKMNGYRLGGWGSFPAWGRSIFFSTDTRSTLWLILSPLLSACKIHSYLSFGEAEN